MNSRIKALLLIPYVFVAVSLLTTFIHLENHMQESTTYSSTLQEEVYENYEVNEDYKVQEEYEVYEEYELVENTTR